MKTPRDPARLTPGESAVLELIRDNPDQLTGHDIAERLDSTPGSIKVMVARLRRKGYKITSPRYRAPGSRRRGVRQTYRLDGEPRV